MILNVNGVNREYQEPMELKKIAEEFQSDDMPDIVLALVDNKLRELSYLVEKDANIEFLTTGHKIGNETYRRSVTLLMLKAFDDLYGKEDLDGVKILYSISKGYYCELEGFSEELSQSVLKKVKDRMARMVQLDLPIAKKTYSTEEALQKFSYEGMYDKERLFKYRRVSRVNMYSIEEYENYFYGYMVPSTGYLKYFDLFIYNNGFVLQMPTDNEPSVVPPFKPQKKLSQVLKEAEDWSIKLDIDTVGALNDKIASGAINDLILVQEALQEKSISNIAEMIVEQDKKLVLIAGPSSSGKTSFSHRLSIQLIAQGLRPHPICLDDYFVNREFTPKDENGNYDFECIEAIDMDQFNKDMADLLAGKKVSMPTFNFQTGKREYKGNYLQLDSADVLVIEGIHGLNPRMTESLPQDSKFKIYISALTQLNVDEHNRISTTDGRLLRRIIRDARTRGNTAQATIRMWDNVRRGEEMNIFPYQEEADVMFNSALIYELGVIKQYAEPLLFAIPKDCKEAVEAKRLLKFLDYFLGIGTDMIPNNSILKEFIGGSFFPV